MAEADERPAEVNKRDILLSGGRTLQLTEYGNGSIRITLTGSPYVITCLEQTEDGAVLKLSPGREGSNAHRNWVRDHSGDDR
ncbi:hypothetical protein LXH13_01340 [Streptomyces spinosirectus]|jgi:hypothetical protein|uniref:hypothetical protein n=1 Tax=Streptomyces TaxID=1883 RepID=UPI001C9DBF84|nr:MULTISPECIES: hypothetical protein [Streptomyces]MBY8339673.1 hypothetical protein [Streptomyces plumbidurans]UIR15745.1 hypothetical protein LXH13_01340 [Streptomyces spinosirectus]